MSLYMILTGVHIDPYDFKRDELVRPLSQEASASKSRGSGVGTLKRVPKQCPLWEVGWRVDHPFAGLIETWFLVFS